MRASSLFGFDDQREPVASHYPDGVAGLEVRARARAPDFPVDADVAAIALPIDDTAAACDHRLAPGRGRAAARFHRRRDDSEGEARAGKRRAGDDRDRDGEIDGGALRLE